MKGDRIAGAVAAGRFEMVPWPLVGRRDPRSRGASRRAGLRCLRLRRRRHPARASAPAPRASRRRKRAVRAARVAGSGRRRARITRRCMGGNALLRAREWRGGGGRSACRDDVSRRFAAIGALLFAAEASAAAAAAHRSAGRQASARTTLATAQQLRRQCEGASTIGLALVGEFPDLTMREREVALLAAKGLSSREIASLLVLAPRTVENHLQHVFGKLGVTSRADLAAALDAAAAGETDRK
jgi:DNA-binding CsgD family transcriptional regulator